MSQKIPEQKEKPEKKKIIHQDDDKEEHLIRIAGYDIPGSKRLLAGLTRIKGVGWAISNATCLKLGFSRDKKISELTREEIKKIEEEQIKIKLNVTEHFYQMARKRNYIFGAIAAISSALLFLDLSCPRTVTNRVYVPYFLYEQSKTVEIESAGTYNIYANPHGIFVFPTNTIPSEER